jgi:putative ABC transport system substrate-binding protein
VRSGHGALTRRAFLTGASAALAAAPARAQRPEPRLPRVGYLNPAQSDTPTFQKFRQALAELGYLEGRTVVSHPRFAQGRYDRLSALARELVTLDVDVIVAVSPPAIRATLDATSRIPIVMAFSGIDPVAAGFVQSVARPGSNVTGLVMPVSELSAKRLEVLKQALPSARRVATLGYATNTATREQLRALAAAAPALGVTVAAVEVTGAGQYASAFEEAARGKPDALMILSDPTLYTDRKQLVALARRHRLAAASDWREWAEEGLLLSFGVDNLELYRGAVRYVDRILKGARPGDLPVEHPTKFELVVNLQTAKALGLTISPSVLLRADQVLQ